MPLHMTPETEAKLDQLAQRIQRDKNELLEEAVNNFIRYNEWFERKVGASLAAAESGRVVPDDDVRRWLEQRERS